MSDFRMKEIETELANRGPSVDHGGTITNGGVSQQVMAANPARSYLLFQNQSGSDMWINFTGAAAATQPSVLIAPGDAYVQEAGFVFTDAVNVFCATTAAPFAAKEG